MNAFTWEGDWELEEMQKDLREGRINSRQYENFLILTGRYKIYEGSIRDDYQLKGD